MINTPKENPVEKIPVMVTSRTPAVLVTLVCFLLGLVSPFLYVTGMNTTSFSARAIGFAGTLAAVAALVILPILRKRLGFTFYDWLAILIALLFSLSQAPGFIRS